MFAAHGWRAKRTIAGRLVFGGKRFVNAFTIRRDAAVALRRDIRYAAAPAPTRR
jgi:hypothetical protein